MRHCVLRFAAWAIVARTLAIPAIAPASPIEVGMGPSVDQQRGLVDGSSERAYAATPTHEPAPHPSAGEPRRAKSRGLLQRLSLRGHAGFGFGRDGLARSGGALHAGVAADYWVSERLGVGAQYQVTQFGLLTTTLARQLGPELAFRTGTGSGYWLFTGSAGSLWLERSGVRFSGRKRFTGAYTALEATYLGHWGWFQLGIAMRGEAFVVVHDGHADLGGATTVGLLVGIHPK